MNLYLVRMKYCSLLATVSKRYSEKWSPKNGPRKNGPRKNSPRENGPREKWCPEKWSPEK